VFGFTKWFLDVFDGQNTNDLLVCETDGERKALDLRYLEKGNDNNVHVV